LFSPGPLAPKLAQQRQQRLPFQRRVRIFNFPPPNNVLPPGAQALPPNLFRTAERLAYRSPRGRVINYLFPNGLFPVPPPVVPTFRITSRPRITPGRRGRFYQVIIVPLPPPGPGPLVGSMTRQAGTSSHYLRPRRGTFVLPPLPFIPKPPPVPPPITDSDLDVGSSMGRKLWRRRHVAMKYELSKSLVWERYNG
jgi:hypothetical protein